MGPACNFQSSARQVYGGGACPWQGSGQESSADQSYWSGSGQFPSFRNCIVLYLMAARMQFSKLSPPSVQRRHLALGMDLARKVRPTSLIGAALANSTFSGIVSASANRVALHVFSVQRRTISWLW